MRVARWSGDAMKDPDLIAAGISVVLVLVIALALRLAGIVLEAP